MSYAEKALLVGKLETIQIFSGEDPELFLARVYEFNTMQVVGIEKSDGEIVQINVGQLSDDSMSRFIFSSNITRVLVEHTIRTLYANGIVKESEKPQVPPAAAAAPRDPHTLTVGGFR